MKRYSILFFLLIIHLLNHGIILSQDSTKVSNIDTLFTLKQLRIDIQQQSEKSQSLLNESEHNFELASKIIDWSSMFFTVLVVVLGIAGWIGTRRFNKIDETSKEMTLLLDEMREELKKMQSLKNETLKTLEGMKVNIDNDRKIFMEIVYYINQGEIAFDNGDLNKAISLYRKILKLKPDNSEAHLKIGRAFSADGNQEKAISHLNESIRLNPNNPEAYFYLGRTYRRNENIDLSIEYFQKVLEIEPNFSVAACNLGHSYLKKNYDDKAIEWYLKSIIINPDYYVAYMGLARISYRKGEIKKMHEFYDKSKKIIDKIVKNGRYRYWCMYHLGEISAAFNEAKQAETYYKKALEMNSAPETLKSALYDLNLIKKCENSPKCINTFIELIEDRLSE